MRRRIGVVLGQGMHPVGELRFEDDGTRQFSAFRYAQSWLEQSGAFALAPDLPLSEAPHVRSGRQRAGVCDKEVALRAGSRASLAG